MHRLSGWAPPNHSSIDTRPRPTRPFAGAGAGDDQLRRPSQEAGVIGLQPRRPLPALGQPPQGRLTSPAHVSGLAQRPPRPQVSVQQQRGVVAGRFIRQALERQADRDVIHASRLPPTASKARQNVPWAATAHHHQLHPQHKRFNAGFGTLRRLLPLAMAPAIATPACAPSALHRFPASAQRLGPQGRRLRAAALLQRRPAHPPQHPHEGNTARSDRSRPTPTANPSAPAGAGALQRDAGPT